MREVFRKRDGREDRGGSWGISFVLSSFEGFENLFPKLYRSISTRSSRFPPKAVYYLCVPPYAYTSL